MKLKFFLFILLLLLIPFQVRSQYVELPLTFESHIYNDSLWIQLQVSYDSLFTDLYCQTDFELRMEDPYTFNVMFQAKAYQEYYWRGRHKSVADTSGWSKAYHFILTVAPSPPICATPENGVTIKR